MGRKDGGERKNPLPYPCIDDGSDHIEKLAWKGLQSYHHEAPKLNGLWNFEIGYDDKERNTEAQLGKNSTDPSLAADGFISPTELGWA